MHKLNGLLPLKLRDHGVSGNRDPMLVLSLGGVLGGWCAGEWLGPVIYRQSRGSDSLQEGRAGSEQPDRISQTQGKLIGLELIERSTDPSPAARVQLQCACYKTG